MHFKQPLQPNTEATETISGNSFPTQYIIAACSFRQPARGSVRFLRKPCTTARRLMDTPQRGKSFRRGGTQHGIAWFMIVSPCSAYTTEALLKENIE